MSKRKQTTKQEWERLVKKFDKSNLTQAGFCKGEGIRHSAFAYWCSRLSSKSNSKYSMRTKKKAPRKIAAKDTSPFIEITDQTEERSFTVKQNGVTITMPLDASAESIRNVMGALNQPMEINQ